MAPPTAPHQNPALMIIECGLMLLSFLVAFGWPGIGSGWFARAESFFSRLGRRHTLSVIVVGLTALLARLAILPLYPIPHPFVPDDFSFLLAADTFLHGRLANPTPAMWTHFESIHISMQPTMVSMYFPSQGLLMALGKLAFGNVWFGVLLSSVLMCAALTWMLQAWLPGRWALLGGLIAVLRLGLFTHWVNSLHAAGMPAALGGALVLGAMPRLMKSGSIRHGLILAIGIALLVLTRPYDGMLLCLPVAVVLVRWAFRGSNRPAPAVLMRRAALPLALVFASIAWMGYYDLKCFGKATTLPYTVNRTQYAMAPYYIWQQPRPEPTYRQLSLQHFYEGEMIVFNRIHSVEGFIPAQLSKVEFALLFYCGFILLLPLAMLRRTFRDRRMRFLVVCFWVMCAGMFIENFFLTHYVAAFVPLFYVIGVQCMRHLRHWRPEGRQAGLALTRLIVVACVAMACVRLSARPLGIGTVELPPSSWNMGWYGPEIWGTERVRVQSELEAVPGNHLVLVHYGPDHHVLREWVYNDADIDSSRIIWAHDMGPASNRELTSYYAGRKVWLVEPEQSPARITPYSEAAALNAGPAYGATNSSSRSDSHD